MLETVREFGLEQLQALGELVDARREHARHFDAGRTRGTEWAGLAPGAWLDRLEAERDNLREALAWEHEEPAPELARRLAIALHWFWRSRGPVGEGRRWMATLLAGTGEMAPTAGCPPIRRRGPRHDAGRVRAGRRAARGKHRSGSGCR